MTQLRFTVSGGLEGFAEDEVRKHLRPIHSIGWTQRGKSGSQLQIELDSSWPVRQSLQLRFVEYVYLVVYESEDVPVDVATNTSLLLAWIQDCIQSNLDKPMIEAAMEIGNDCQHLLQEKTVGLEDLPGILLPTPIVDQRDKDKVPNDATKPFIVNTIYTQASVAKAVVGEFVRLVQQHSPEIMETLWLDAGAGSEALLDHLPSPQLGIDIQPCGANVHAMDFLDVTHEWLLSQHSTFQSLCIISNPPFSEGSRGDYSAIVKFINHSVTLGANYVGMIVPTKFVRERVWQSLGMNPRARLLARFPMPHESFTDPSKGTPVHIQSSFVFFQLEPHAVQKIGGGSPVLQNAIHVIGKRDKGAFRDLPTADLVHAVVEGLAGMSVPLAPQDQSRYLLSCRLGKDLGGANRLQLSLLLNPDKPLSLANCVCRRVPRHSLGWISSSAKPPVAQTMLAITTDTADTDVVGLVVNAMSGEGTIELESQCDHLPHPFFVIAGDKNEIAAAQTARRLHDLEGRRPLVDMVIWDAQRLPLRKEIADVFLADLPFAGSAKKKHQEPSTTRKLSALDYKLVMAQGVQVLRSGGKAALLSADTKSLGHAVGGLHWSKTMQISNMNLGGLSGHFLTMRKLAASFKDMSMWVEEQGVDLSEVLYDVAGRALQDWCLDDRLELANWMCPSSGQVGPLVVAVERKDTYYHEGTQRFRQCYRFRFDGRLTNCNAKLLEQVLRRFVAENPPQSVLELC